MTYRSATSFKDLADKVSEKQRNKYSFFLQFSYDINRFTFRKKDLDLDFTEFMTQVNKISVQIYICIFSLCSVQNILEQICRYACAGKKIRSS